MTLAIFRWLQLLCFLVAFYRRAYALPAARLQNEKQGIHLPIQARQTPPTILSNLFEPTRPGRMTGRIGLGDFVDVAYNIVLSIGKTLVPLVLDTGSSDLWVLSSTAAAVLNTSLPLYPSQTPTFTSSNLSAMLLYGDSLTGTHAFGAIGQDNVNLAGLAVEQQYFAAINDTNTSVLDTGSAGIFGLGFPLNSVIWSTVLDQSLSTMDKRSLSLSSADRSNYRTRFFPSHLKHLSAALSKRASPSEFEHQLTSRILASYAKQGPLLTRLVEAQALSSPMFSVALQRDTIDLSSAAPNQNQKAGQGHGQLSIGVLPDGLAYDYFTWVPLRHYTHMQGGLAGPVESPDETYPISWEVYVDNVYLDGKRLPRSSLISPHIRTSALIDTGNSLIRGPPDVVALIGRLLASSSPVPGSDAKEGDESYFDCATPHTLTFGIGGQLFPIDPRDLIYPAYENRTDACVSNVVATDVPQDDGEGYLFSWSLGVPFLKSVTAAFYYGNITHPSVDPPRIGLVSTVPEDAGERLKEAVGRAKDGNLPEMSEAPPGLEPTKVMDPEPVLALPSILRDVWL